MNQLHRHSSDQRASYWRRSLLLSPVFAAFAGALTFAMWVSVQPVGTTFPGFFVWDNGYLVALHSLSWTGPQAELPLNGGRVVEVDGEPIKEMDAYLASLRSEAPGRVHQYTVLHDGQTRIYPVPSMTFRPIDYLKTFGVYLFSAIAFFLIAGIALLLKQRDERASAIGLAAGWMGLSLCFAIDYVLSHRAIALYIAAEALTPVVLWNFLLRFPIRHVARPTLVLTLLAAGLGGIVLGVLNLSSYYDDPTQSRLIARVVGVLIGVTGVATGVSFFHAFRNATTPHVRRQAAVVLAAGLVAISVPGLAVIGFYLFGWDLSFGWIVAFLPAFPAPILYSIVRQDLLSVERLARVTTGYVLATGSLALAYAGIVFVLAESPLGPHNAANPFVAFVLILGFALVFEPLRQRIQRSVDRAFYRSEVSAASALEQSGFELARAPSAERAVRIIEAQAEESLRVDWVRFVNAEQGSNDALHSEAVIFRDRAIGFLECGAKKSGAPFSDAERELLGGLASQLALGLETAHSVEELQRTQAMLLRSERLAAIGEFAGAMAHGIRNPLAGIRATAEIAAEEDSASQASFGAIVQDVDRLEQRIQTLLDFSRPFQPEIRATPLGDVVSNVASTFTPRAEREGITLTFEDPVHPVEAEIDPDYLEEALLEIVGNAFAHVGPGDRVSLAIGRDERRGPWIEVSDTGPGIPEAIRERIFELFFTTRAGGTGLGLATVRKIVSRMGGSVDIKTTNRAGTCFEVYFPR